MNSLTKNKNKKAFAVIVISALILLTPLFFYLFSFKATSNETVSQPSINYTTPTSEQTQAGKDIKALNNADSKNTPESTGSSAKEQVTLTINYASQDSNRDLNLRVMINALDDSGSCLLQIHKGGEIAYSSSVDTMAQSSYSTCSGFTIPGEQLEPGLYTITILYSSNIYQGSASKELTIR